jgi:hypothetical protein
MFPGFERKAAGFWAAATQNPGIDSINHGTKE